MYVTDAAVYAAALEFDLADHAIARQHDVVGPHRHIGRIVDGAEEGAVDLFRDVAFDIDAQGKVVVYPMRLVVSPITPFRDVGLLKGTGTFDAITRAPNSGYLTDKSVTLSPGEVLILQTARNTGNDICIYGISPYIFAKIGLDSVDLKDRSIFFKSTVNPNCGFRSFKTGIPTD